MSAQTPPRPGAASPPDLFRTLSDDVQVVAQDIRRLGLKRAIGGTLSNLEAFYLTADDRRKLAALSPVRRFLYRTWWFLRGLLMKLTPARRIMLAVAIVALLLGIQRVDINTRSLDLRFPLLGTGLLFTVLILELKDKLLARDELEAGRKVQLALMPSATPHVPGWDVWLHTEPANDVGGDLVDHLQIDEVRHFVALGDVSGKALPAALLSVKLQATLRALAPHFDDLGRLGEAVNYILQRDGVASRYASLVYLLLTADTGRVRVLNAGHMPPLVVRGSTVTVMDLGSMVLGIMPEATFSEQAVTLAAGETLIVYSDGVSEAMNEADDFFGEDRLYAIARESSGEPVAVVGARILEGIARFIGHARPNDDVSLMVVRRGASN